MTIEEVETQEDYNAKLYEYQVLSQASFQVKEEAILKLRRMYPHFDCTENAVEEEILQGIKDSQADIPKLEG